MHISMRCVRFSACVFNKMFLINSYFYFNPRLAFHKGYVYQLYIVNLKNSGDTESHPVCIIFILCRNIIAIQRVRPIQP